MKYVLSAPRLLVELLLALLLAWPALGLSQSVADSTTEAATAADDNLAAADALAPQVTAELTPDEVAPGQSAVLRVTVLVPTYMPKPVEFAELDQPGLRVQLGQRSTTPMSRRIAGQTWSGISRSYQLTPLAPGQFEVGAQSLTITYQHPDSGEVVSQQVVTEAQTLTASVPAAAAGLSPYIAGRAVRLSQRITVTRGADATSSAEPLDSNGEEPIELAVGDSLEREITLTIEGGSALLLPGLDEQAAATGMEVYAASPQVSESDGGGKRVERLTYIAQAGGKVSLPAIALRWFDTDSQQVATAELEGLALDIEGSTLLPAAADTAGWRWYWLAALAALLLCGAAAWRWLWPLWQQRLRKVAERRATTGVDALAALRAAVKAQDYAASLRAWRELEQRAPGLTAEQRAAMADALAALGRLRFASTSAGDAQGLWQALERALPEPRWLARGATAPLLPPLNP